MDKAILVAILTKLADRDHELLARNQPAHCRCRRYTCPTIPQAGCAGGARESAASKFKPISQVSEIAWRKRIKNILRPGRGHYDDSGSSFGIANELDEVANSPIKLLTVGDAQGASPFYSPYSMNSLTPLKCSRTPMATWATALTMPEKS